MDHRLQTKDLIHVGIFTAIYYAVFFAVSMVGYVPVLIPALPFLCPLVAGIPFMLFLTKVRKFGMVTIMGTILSLLMVLTGHPWPILVTGTLFALAGDLIFMSGNYRSGTAVRTGYIVFSQWTVGLMLPLFFMRESYFSSIRASFGDTYAETLMSITPAWVFWTMFAVAGAGGLLGASLGLSVLRKHFRRAGIAA
ncbi:MptD family putative ECF transporter S component [Paenibacillus turpanensis]|uniref:MptD family putative ECF transporter S component n=1 Tax=Paenibacillus turpanensis TaxID=2689078 RepID=UPI001409CA84|nr:MptD family putative ECF transporter S component [Paenibacillus turpanensis]